MRPGATGALAGGSPPSGTDKLYTGQRMEPGDAALGLYNYNARFYSTALGVFVSADTVGDGLNRYAYVHDNPLRYTDSTGDCFNGPDGQKVQQSCSGTDWASWFACALGACSARPDLALMARVGIGEAIFWHEFEDMSTYGSCICGFGGHYIYTDLSSGALYIALAAGATYHDLSPIPDIGWASLATAAHAGSGNFLRASVYGMVYGSNDILALHDGDMIGASPWWRVTPTENVLLRVDIDFGVSLYDHAIYEGDEYDWNAMTVNAARDIGENPGWSPEQRKIIGGRFGVSSGPDPAQACLNEPKCIEPPEFPRPGGPGE